MTKEEAYDKHISPLMNEIIDPRGARVVDRCYRVAYQGYEVIPPTRSMIVTRSGATVTCGGGGE